MRKILLSILIPIISIGCSPVDSHYNSSIREAVYDNNGHVSYYNVHPLFCIGSEIYASEEAINLRFEQIQLLLASDEFINFVGKIIRCT